ncbi:hypothetical protein DM01DRAFT_1406838 [Hesseltinella vesiculosa]|uniref:Uncharacterized protein n=1 Tax=Hesseltinella vesiculosa TaxID=101127 RepID=A0A1X2GK00_9FUNG|nr:hypothetical protein DM01DRAFT_1406838 [Hesseltinella vesiculosa]
MAHTRSVFRQLLREIDQQYTKVANTDLYANELKAIYRQNKSATDPAKIAAMNQTADDLLTFLVSSRKHKDLRERYSTLVMEQKKRVEMSAHRVGLQLPKQYDASEHVEGQVQDRVNKAFHK